MDDQEMRALTFLAMRVRKATFGAGPWDEVGVMANLRKVQSQSLAHTIENVIRHAADANVKSPGVIASGFKPSKLPEPMPRGSYPPKLADECPTHPGAWRDNCAPCTTDRLAYDYEETTMTNRPGDAAAGLAACRERLGGGVA